jgi:hypothetical protein
VSHADSHGQASTGPSFSSADCAALIDDDKRAARSLAYLVNGIFILGVLLYTFVSLSIIN